MLQIHLFLNPITIISDSSVLYTPKQSLGGASVSKSSRLVPNFSRRLIPPRGFLLFLGLLGEVLPRISASEIRVSHHPGDSRNGGKGKRKNG